MLYDKCDKEKYIRLAMEYNAAPPGYMQEATRAELLALQYRVPKRMHTAGYIRRCGRPGDVTSTCFLRPY